MVARREDGPSNQLRMRGRAEAVVLLLHNGYHAKQLNVRYLAKICNVTVDEVIHASDRLAKLRIIPRRMFSWEQVRATGKRCTFDADNTDIDQWCSPCGHYVLLHNEDCACGDDPKKACNFYWDNNNDRWSVKCKDHTRRYNKPHHNHAPFDHGPSADYCPFISMEPGDDVEDGKDDPDVEYFGELLSDYMSQESIAS